MGVVKMGTRHCSAWLSSTLLRPFTFRHSATSVLGTQHTASPEGSTPACSNSHTVSPAVLLLYLMMLRTRAHWQYTWDRKP